MMRYTLIFICCSILSLNLFSQTKRISGDTTFWYDHTKWLMSKFDSKDLSVSNDEFNFRIQYYGQIIEVWKNNGNINGELTNYVFKTGKNNKTIFSKEILSDSTSLEIYKLIRESGILDLDSDSMIEGWQQGTDGTTYIFEYADKDDYKFKKYWTPSSQGSLKEAQIVGQFMTDISSLLQSKERYDKFRNSLPKNGCYTNGGMTVLCFQSNNYFVGYTGSTKLPIGYNIELNMGYIGNLRANVGLAVNHIFDSHGNYDFSPSLSTYNLFIRNRKGTNDFIVYTYRKRKHENINRATKYQNHNALYGVNFKSTTVGLGVDFLSGEKSKVGGNILINQYLSSPKMSISGKAFIYKSQFDYKIALSKSFKIEALSFPQMIYASLYYESLLKHGSLGWSLSIPL